MLTLSIIDDVLFNPIRNIFLGLDVIIYKFIDYLYQVFITIASARIFKDVNFTEIIDRVYIIIGVVMLFITAYSLLAAIINPDNITKGEMSATKLIPNMIIAIVLIAIVPTIFNLMYQAQDIILSQNIIGKAILGGTYDAKDPGFSFEALGKGGEKILINTGEIDNNATLLKNSGKIMSSTIFRAFFVPTIESKEAGVDPSTLIKHNVAEYFSRIKGPVATVFACLSGGESGLLPNVFKGVPVLTLLGGIGSCAVNEVISLGSWIGGGILDFLGIDINSEYTWTLAQADLYAEASGDIGIYTMFMDNVAEGEIEYSWFFASAAGIFVCWTLLAYCIDLGVRAVKLAFYQLIAPIPILCRMIPKQKKIFDNWLKIVLTTFAEVFIRVAVIYFVVYLVSIIATTSLFADFWTNSILGTPTWGVRSLARVAIILGLLAFAKQAPKLISDITGIDSKNMSLGINIGKKLGENGALAIPTAVGGAFTAGVRRWMNPSKDRSKWQRFTDSISAAGRGGYKGAKTGWSANGFKDVKNGATTAAGDAIDKQTKKVAAKAKEKERYDAWSKDPENAGRLWVEYKGDQFKKWAKSGGTNYQGEIAGRVKGDCDSLSDIYKGTKEKFKKVKESVDTALTQDGHYPDTERFIKTFKGEGITTQAAAIAAIEDGTITGEFAAQVLPFLQKNPNEFIAQQMAYAQIEAAKDSETVAAIKDLGKNMVRTEKVVENLCSDLLTSGMIGDQMLAALKQTFTEKKFKDVFDMSHISDMSGLTSELKKMVEIAKADPSSEAGVKALRQIKVIAEQTGQAMKNVHANLQDDIAREKREEKK